MGTTPVTASNLRIRKNFAKNKQVIDIPNLIELQKSSYEAFLQKEMDPDRRGELGLNGVFKSVFPITDFNNTASLEFVSYTLEPAKYDVDECRQRGMTFAAPIKVTLRLIVFDVDEETEARSIRDVKEQEVYLGEIPLMTANGSFIINGTERVVVSQLHRSPGVFFDHDGGKNNASGKLIYNARVIPYRGSWLDFEFDQKDLIHVRIDRRRKFPVTILLKSLGYNTEQLLEHFYDLDEVHVKGKKLFRNLDIERMSGQRAIVDIIDPKTGEALVKAGRRITRAVVKKVQQLDLKEIEVTPEDLEGKILAKPLIDESTGEILADANAELSKAEINRAIEAGIDKFHMIFFDGLSVGPYLRNTLLVDKVNNKEESLLKIYQHLRPGEPPTLDAATTFFHRLFFDPETYDLSEVGRIKINHRFTIPMDECPPEHRTLTNKDILSTVKTLIDLKNGRGVVDDIDHLGNRRVRSVGELLENQYRIGLVRMERAIRERMSLQDVETMMPHDLVNAKPVNAVVKEFFGSSQLSQFMDQTNPLSEITHKRRLSALGPGGLTRDRAGFEVRDVHPTHYGRICPIETPEGPNIGLIASLATYARINNYGFIETPYRKVDAAKVSSAITYMSALEEAGHKIAQASREIAGQKEVQEDTVVCRVDGEYEITPKDQVSLMDVSPSQLVSIAASLIPFLEHDDANRALMGSNMQRQAVPLLRSRAPLVGTGVERLVARDSGTSVVAQNDGVVEEVDASRVVVRRLAKGGELGANVDIYNLTKYQRTNQNTCFNQKPIVKVGDRVGRSDIIADGPSTELGELALGQNIVVAFTPWMGYNFEDSILISERLIKEDTYTSIHIEEFECVARDTKLGKEEISRDIANVGEEALKDLDTSGIIRIGADVKPGAILVGKVTPKGETQLSPEEKLLRAIFGEKAGDVRDTSLRAPSGVYGTVIDAQVYSREGADRDERLAAIIEEKKRKLEKDLAVEQNVIKNNAIGKLKDILVGKKTTSVLLNEDGSQKLLNKGQDITSADLETIPFELLAYIPLDQDLEFQVTKILDGARNQLDAVRMVFNEKIDRLRKGDELPPGVIKMVKVYVAIKRKLQVGDKFAGRHGNKGVVSKVLPVEDMPYLADGTAVDMVLNPLGVPSRMNIGQVLEVHLGWAAHELGKQLSAHLDKWNTDTVRTDLKHAFGDSEISEKIDNADEESLKKIITTMKNGVHVGTPVFDGARESDVKDLLAKAQLPSTGKTILFDGRSGVPFQNPVTVGIMYMLKLHHLVEEKIHARSIGPYSLVSQQPLGGKAQFGGQRLGEMEVWAIEAYGAAYSLQEFLTVKSDDVAGRTRMYESIVKGENILEPGLPESFNVLVKELQSLALNVELMESDILTDNMTEEDSQGDGDGATSNGMPAIMAPNGDGSGGQAH
jgi:DNA-directed RNA polymerase subunit beta